MVESPLRSEPGARRAGDAAAGLHNEGDSHVFDAAHGAGSEHVISHAPSSAEGISVENTIVENPSPPALLSTGSNSKTANSGQLNDQSKKTAPTRLPRKNKSTSHPPPSSATTSQPILVNPAPSEPDMPSRSSLRRSRQPKPSSEVTFEPKHDLPPLSAFSFSEILAAIDPDVHSSIDTIAEICGKSKLSLANEYGSHMPPHAEFAGMSNEVEREEGHGLEAVEEVASDTASAGIEEEQSRKTIWGPFGTRVGAGKAVTSTSEVTSTATLGRMGRAEIDERHLADVVPSPAVRHLQALTRVT